MFPISYMYTEFLDTVFENFIRNLRVMRVSHPNSGHKKFCECHENPQSERSTEMKAFVGFLGRRSAAATVRC